MMNIKLELLKGTIHDLIDGQLENISIDADEIADTTATKALSEIQGILVSDIESDFEIVERIVCVFEKYHLNAGGQHDF